MSHIDDRDVASYNDHHRDDEYEENESEYWTKSSRMPGSTQNLAHQGMMGSIANMHGTTDNSSSVGSSTSFSSSAITNPQSPVLSLRNTIFEFIISYRRSETLVKNRMHMIGWIILHVYMIYYSIITSSISTTESEEKKGAIWGVVGGWIFRVLHFPLDFGIQYYPYELVYAFSVMGLALELLCLGTFYLKIVLSRFGNSMQEKLKVFSRILVTVIIILSPFLLFVHSYPIAVEMNIFSSSSSTGIYMKHFSSPLFSAAANIGLVVVGGIGISLVLSISGLGIFVVFETIPTKGAKTIFIADRIYPICCLLLNNQIGVVLTVILTYELCVLSAALKFLMTLLFLVSLFVAVPFYRRWENCVYCGVGVSRALGSLGPLISLLVSKLSGSSEIEIGGGVMTGITLALMIGGFILGYLIMEIYTRLKIRSIRRELKAYFSGVSVLNIVSELTNMKLIGNAIMFLRFNSLSSDNSEDSDRALAIKFIRSANVRSTSSIDLLISASCFIMAQGKDFDNGTMMALGIMRRVLRNSPSFVQLFHFYLRSKEIEVQSQDGDAVSFELQKVLEKLEKRQAKIINLHQDFFKELSSENPSENALQEINRNAHNLTRYCETTYKNSMSTNANNKTLIRTYAHFLETFKFEYELAAELYEEANQIEEEKSKSNRKKNQDNRVLPYAPSTADFMKKKKSTATLKNAVSFDEVIDNWDSVSARAEDTMREEAFYRNSINTAEHRKSFLVMFFPFVIVSILIILFMLTLSLVVSSEFTSRTSLEETICSISGGPSIIANHIRSLQARYRFLNETKAGSVHKLAATQANYMLTLIQNVQSASSGSFFPAITDDYITQKWTYKVPNKQLVGESEQIYSTLNVSVLDFVHLFSQHAPTVISQFSSPADLNNTATNFPVLFFLYNRETMTQAFDGLCQYFIQYSIQRADTLSQVFLGTSGTLLFCYILFIIFYFSMLAQYFSQITRIIIQIFRKIPKDEVGKIYHSLKSTKTGDYGEATMSPKFKIITYTTITFLAIALVSPLQIYEFQTNKQNQYITMKTAAAVNSVLSSATSVNFKLTEMIIRSSMSDYSLEELHLKNQKQLMNISTSWAYAIRGAPDLGYTNAMFGKYSDVDALLSYSCGSNSTVTNTTAYSAALSILPESQIKQVSCVGLEKLVHSFITIASEYNEDFYAGFYSKAFETTQYFTNLYFPALVSVQLIYEFISVYVQNTKQSEDYLTIISTVLGSIVVLVCSWLSYLAMMDLFREIQSVRIMLNYIPKDVVDTIPDMIDYIVNHRLPSTTEKIKSLMKKRNTILKGVDADSENMIMTRSILDSAVDGSVVCNTKGDIILYNPSSEDMFGYTKEEILGLRLETLFTEGNVEKMTKLIDSMKVCDDNAVLSDSFEVTGIRKNKTTFPAFVSMSVSRYLGNPILSCFVKDVTQLKKHSLLLGEEKKKSEELLLNILPLPVANRLKQGETFIAEKFADVTIFFSDMVGFTKMSSGMEADQLVMMLNTIVNEFDKLTEKYLIDKIKTIGDAYFAVSGTHSSKSSDHPERMLKFSISVYSFLRDFNIKFGKEVNLRIGMHTGPCVGGVIGTKKFAYDLWGDTINTASRMESTGVPGRIQISRATYERVFDLGYEFEERESIYVKGKGEMKTYLLKDKHHANPLPNIEEINEETTKQQIPQQKSTAEQPPTITRSESSHSEGLTVLKLNSNQPNIPPSQSTSPSNSK